MPSVVLVALGTFGDALPLCVLGAALSAARATVKCTVIISSDVDPQALISLLPSEAIESLCITRSAISSVATSDVDQHTALDELTVLASRFSPCLICFNLWSVAASHVAEALGCRIAVCSPAPAPTQGSISSEHRRAIRCALGRGRTTPESDASVEVYASFWMAPLLSPCYAAWRAAQRLPPVPVIFSALASGAPFPPVLLGYDSLVMPPPGWWPAEIAVCGSWSWRRLRRAPLLDLCPALLHALGLECESGHADPTVIVDLGSVARAWARRLLPASAAAQVEGDTFRAAEDALLLCVCRAIASAVSGVVVLRVADFNCSNTACCDAASSFPAAGVKRARGALAGCDVTSTISGTECRKIHYTCGCVFYVPPPVTPASAGDAQAGNVHRKCSSPALSSPLDGSGEALTGDPVSRDHLCAPTPRAGAVLVVPHTFSHREALCSQRHGSKSLRESAKSAPISFDSSTSTRAVAALVHHGGAGTSASAAAAGVPQVVLPLAFDQPLWAARLEALGVAPAALKLPQGCGAEAAANAVAALVREVVVVRPAEYLRAAGALSGALAEAAAESAVSSAAGGCSAAPGAAPGATAASAVAPAACSHTPAEGRPEEEEAACGEGVGASDVEFTPGTLSACRTLLRLVAACEASSEGRSE